jgi:hypothetical protein
MDPIIIIIAVHKLGSNMFKKIVILVTEVCVRNINKTFKNISYVRSHKTVHIHGYAFTFKLKMFIRKPNDGARWHKHVAQLK